MNPDEEERARATYFWDRIRGASMGTLEPYWQTFALVIAIRVFAAPDAVKAILPAAFPIGFMFLPLTVALVTRSGLSVSMLCAVYMMIAGGCLLAGAVAPTMWIYVAMVAASMIVTAQIVPLVTQIYTFNYPANERGRRYSTAFLLSACVAVIFAYAGGRLLDLRLEYYPVLLVVVAASSFAAAFAFSRIPTAAFPAAGKESLTDSLSLIWKDRFFGWLMLGWAVLALGTMMTYPIRVEYMANPCFHVNATNEQIGVILGAIPLMARLLSTKVWGYLFDHFNLISLRIALNLISFFSILLFFFTTNLLLMSIAMVFFGLAFGGGRIMWQLWVTKIVPDDKVTSYMTANTAATGIQGLVAPIFGYLLLHFTNPEAVGWIAALLVGISTLIFMPARIVLAKRSGLS